MVDNFFILSPNLYEIMGNIRFDRECVDILEKDPKFSIIQGVVAFGTRKLVIISGEAEELYKDCDVRYDIRNNVFVYMKDANKYAKYKLKYGI